ncbi:MAG: redoxin domain-containing protein [Planctomycetota bacterium]
MRLSLVLAALAVLGLGIPPARAQLGVGDPAPAFTVTEWLKGTPQDLAAGKGKTTFVLDFWATWCAPCLQVIPHLTKLQQKYADQGVVVISVTSPGLDSRQQLGQVKQFLRDLGARMGYTIAWDQTNKMWIEYMLATGAMGIPYTFVIDKSGRLAWQGDPRTGIEDVLNRLLAGTFDIEKEAARSRNKVKLNQLLVQFQMAVQAGDFRQAIAVLDKGLALDPTDYGILATVHQVFANDLNDPGGYRSWVESFIDKHPADSAALSSLVYVLLGIEPPTQRMPDLMLRAAKLAFDAGGGTNLNAIEAYARAAHRVGNIDQAIHLQKQAIEIAPEPLKANLTKTLEYYRTCRELGDTSF